MSRSTGQIPFEQDVVGPETDDRKSTPRRLAGGRFHATTGTFAGGPLQPTIDGLTRWVEDAFRRELAARPSMHVYVRKLEPDIIARIEELRTSSVILEAIRRQFPSSSVITPLAHTDELYISHYNKDRGGDQGLFDKHYDGNLGFVRFVSVVRALIYLQSDTSYTVVFGDSNVRRAFGTYEFGLLDFHRELHWVEGTYTPGAPQRILLKCNYLIAPAGVGWAARLVMAANTAVFYVVKAAMEYSKSPRTPAQKAVGLLCNVARTLNNVHPLVPILLTLVLFVAAAWGAVALLSRV
jgi:hypothetical protein